MRFLAHSAAHPCTIDRPTPPPCAADGTCYPNENTWGWYPCHWRQWPGEVLASDARRRSANAGRGTGRAIEAVRDPDSGTRRRSSAAIDKEARSSSPDNAPAVPPAEGGHRRGPQPALVRLLSQPVRPQAHAASPYPAPNYPTPNYPSSQSAYAWTTSSGAHGRPRPTTIRRPRCRGKLSSSSRRAAMADASREPMCSSGTAPAAGWQ